MEEVALETRKGFHKKPQETTNCEKNFISNSWMIRIVPKPLVPPLLLQALKNWFKARLEHTLLRRQKNPG